jgi:hypothetical protein
MYEHLSSGVVHRTSAYVLVWGLGILVSLGVL